jgi:4-aminobutyrate aminotransferase/(S)-3-amino-2-methylpropionate transaminase
VPADGFLPALQEWCTANGVVMIADEIQSGMARTGRYYASEHFGWTPDLVLSAKGIAAGLPLAAVTGRAEIMDASQPGGLGGTFGGNPVACAAAIAVFEAIEEEGLLPEGRRIEATLTAGLERLRAKYDLIGDIRGRGAMIAIELVQSGTGGTTREPNPEAVGRLVSFAAERGVLFLSAGTWGNVLRFLPSLRMTDALIEDALGVLDEALASLA